VVLYLLIGWWRGIATDVDCLGTVPLLVDLSGPGGIIELLELGHMACGPGQWHVLSCCSTNTWPSCGLVLLISSVSSTSCRPSGQTCGPVDNDPRRPRGHASPVQVFAMREHRGGRAGSFPKISVGSSSTMWPGLAAKA
jgi:hypothetical protein